MHTRPQGAACGPFPRPPGSSLRLGSSTLGRAGPRGGHARRHTRVCSFPHSQVGSRKKKIDPLGRGSSTARVQNRRAAERASEQASEHERALARSPEWEIRRYKTDLLDWYQPVQRPDAAAALVARVRERRSRCSARGTYFISKKARVIRAQKIYTHRCDTRDQRTQLVVPPGGESVQDFFLEHTNRVTSELARCARTRCPRD